MYSHHEATCIRRKHSFVRESTASVIVVRIFLLLVISFVVSPRITALDYYVGSLNRNHSSVSTMKDDPCSITPLHEFSFYPYFHFLFSGSRIIFQDASLSSSSLGIMVGAAAANTSTISTTSLPLKVAFINSFTGLPAASSMFIPATLRGIEAAFLHVNQTTGGIVGAGNTRYPLQLIVRDNGANFSLHQAALEEVLVEHPDIIAHLPTSFDTIIARIMPILAREKLLLLGAQTRGGQLRDTYNPQFAFLSTHTRLLSLSMLQYLITTKQCKRIGFMISANLHRETLEGSVHYLEYQSLASVVHALGATASGLYVVDTRLDFGIPTPYQPAAVMANFSKHRPQCVIMLALPATSVAQFVLTSLGIMGPEFIFAVSDNLGSVIAQVISLQPHHKLGGRVVIGLPLPLASDLRFAAMRQLRVEAAAVPGASFDLGATGMFFVVGWLHAKFAIAVLEDIAARLRNDAGRANATITRAMFNAAVLGRTPRMVNVHDLSFGAFAGPCTGPQRLICDCNEGGHVADIGVFADNASILPLNDAQARIAVPVGVCANEAVQLMVPLFAAAPRAPSVHCVRRGDVFGDGTLQCGPVPERSLLAGIAALPSFGNVNGAAGLELKVGRRPLVTYDASARLDGFARAATPADQRAALLGLRDEAPVTVEALAIAVPGPTVVPTAALPPASATSAVRAAYLETTCGGVMSVEPVSVLPLAGAPHAFDPCTVRFTGTPEQELHAVAAYAAGRGLALRYVVAFDATGLAVTMAVIERSAAFLSRAGAGRNVAVLAPVVDTIQPLASALAALGSTVGRTILVVVGIASVADTNALVALLAANPETEVVLPHAHAVLWHGALAVALNATTTKAASVGQRLLIATALGPWNAAGAAERFATPAAQLWSRVASFLAPLADPVATSPVSGGQLLLRLYELGAVTSNLFAAGPYTMVPCPQSITQILNGVVICELASGARSVQLVRFAASDGTAPPSDVALVHTEAFSSSRSGFPVEAETAGRAVWVWPVVGSALSVAALVAAVTASLFVYYWRVLRPRRYAPTDASKPFTMVFTDVQSSTALWAEIPEVMAAAMPAHHRLLRAALADHKGYEVRTIGDAFMVAFKHAADAAAFAVAAQFALRRHDWADGGAIDALYARETDERDQAQQRTAQRQGSGTRLHGGSSICAPTIDIGSAAGNEATPPVAVLEMDPPETARAPSPRRRTLTFDPAAGACDRDDAKTTDAVDTTSRAVLVGASRRVTIIESAEQDRRTKLREQERAVAREWEDDGPAAPCPWRGLRIRIGIHTGQGTVDVNRTSGRFDYSGPMVAVAAAVQDAAHGGQVLLSADAHAALSRRDVKALARQVTRGRERIERDRVRTERRRRRHISSFLDAFARPKRRGAPKKISASHLFTTISDAVPVPSTTETKAVWQLDNIAGRAFPRLRCCPLVQVRGPPRGSSPTMNSLIPDLVVTPGTSVGASPIDFPISVQPEATATTTMSSTSSLPGANFSASSALFRAAQEAQIHRDSLPEPLPPPQPLLRPTAAMVPCSRISLSGSSGSPDASLRFGKRSVISSGSSSPVAASGCDRLRRRSLTSRTPGAAATSTSVCEGIDALRWCSHPPPTPQDIQLFLVTLLGTFKGTARAAVWRDLCRIWSIDLREHDRDNADTGSDLLMSAVTHLWATSSISASSHGSPRDCTEWVGGQEQCPSEGPSEDHPSAERKGDGAMQKAEDDNDGYSAEHSSLLITDPSHSSGPATGRTFSANNSRQRGGTEKEAHDGRYARLLTSRFAPIVRQRWLRLMLHFADAPPE